MNKLQITKNIETTHKGKVETRYFVAMEYEKDECAEFGHLNLNQLEQLSAFLGRYVSEEKKGGQS